VCAALRAAHFNLSVVDVGRKAGRDARCFLKGALFFLHAALKMFDGLPVPFLPRE